MEINGFVGFCDKYDFANSTVWEELPTSFFYDVSFGLLIIPGIQNNIGGLFSCFVDVIIDAAFAFAEESFDFPSNSIHFYVGVF